ncbi:MAG: FG-GAP repeat protein [bacterium]
MFKKMSFMLVILSFLVCNTAFGAHTEIVKLTTGDGEIADWFGWSVAISGEYVVIGANYDDDIGHDGGSAYLFHYANGAWTQEQKLFASDGGQNDAFGSSVSIKGDVCIVGAHGHGIIHGTNASGAVFVFKKDESEWVEDTELRASDAQPSDYLGYSVSFDGDCVIAGAHGDDDNGPDSGSAYVFRYDGMSWTEEQKLTASDGQTQDYFGQAVAIDGDLAVVGAWATDESGPYSGSAYIFHFDGESWIEEQKLTANDASAEDHFGSAVSISGNLVVIGAYVDDDMGTSSGSAYAFRRNGTTWIQENKFVASDGEPNDELGYSVAVSPHFAILGARHDNDTDAHAGSVYVYGWNGTGWIEEDKILASDGAVNDWFGSAVSLSGYNVAVGAWGNDEIGTDSGAAYICSTFNPDYKVISADLECLPPAGILPFDVDFYILLSKHYPNSLRTIYANIRVDLANGVVFENWKQGVKTLSSFNYFSYHFSQMLPRSASVFGNNVFTIYAEDITSPPYNQPPYPPSGQTDTDVCVVMGVQ